MRFNEGIVVSGSIDTSYASQDGVAIVCTGSLEIAANGTNSQVVRIISNDAQREMVFDSLGTSGGGSAVAAQLIGNDSGGLRIDASNLPSVGSFFKINTGTEFTFLFNASGNTQRPNDATQININASTDAAVVVDRIVAAINGDPSFSQSSVYYNLDNVSNRPTNITATENGSFTNGITLTANATGTGGNSFFLFTNTSKFSVIQNSNQLFTGGSASGGGSSTQETIASIFTETDDDLVISGSKEVHIRSGEGKAVMILSGTIGGATSPNPSNFTDTNLFVSGTIDSMGTATKGTSVFGGDLHVSGAAQINSVTVTSAGRVGIGTTSPGYKLEVGGSMAVGEYIYHRNDTNTSLRFEDDLLSLAAGGYVGLVLDESASGVDRVYLGGPDDDTAISKKYAQVLVMSGGSGTSTNEANYTDTNFFVSGSIGSQGTSTRGTAVFGGDLVVSGSLIANSGIGAAGVNGQVQYNNNGALGAVPNIYYDASNSRVGISTANPKFPLHVLGNAAVTNNSNPAELGLYRYQAAISTNDELARIYLGGSEDNNNFYPGAAITAVASENWTPSSAEGTDLKFWTTLNTNAALTQRMIITNDGKAGLGLNVPQAEFHIESTNDDADIVLSRNDSNIQNDDTLGTVHFAGTENGTTWGYGARIAAIASGDWTVGSDIPTRLAFYTANDGAGSATQKMVIADDGNVGIGLTTRDEAKLRVSGSILIETDSNNSKPHLIFHNNDVGLIAGASLGRISFSNYPNPTSNESAIIEVLTDGSYATNTKSKMLFKTSDGSNPPSEVMRIEDNTVMIGQPSSATSGFDLSVQGPTYINDQLSAASVVARSRLITDEIQSETASQQLIKWDSANQELEIGAGATVSTVIESGGGRPLYADRTATYGQIRIGTVDGNPQYSAYNIAGGTGLYVEGFDNANTIATFVNRSVDADSDGISIIIGEGSYANTFGGARFDQPGDNNSFIKFTQKDRGSGGPTGNPDALLLCSAITGDGSGGVVYNTSFTGKHFSVIAKSNAVPGFIVKSTGELLLENEVSTALPSVVLTDSIKDKRVYGVIGNIGTGVEGYKHNLTISDEEQDVDINSLGEGKVWVTNIGGNIENGDYITSSNIAGYGMLQGNDILHNYTVAKCTQTVDWNSVIDTIEHEGTTYKKYLIACTYHCG
jgi:hypothetical protein